MVFLLLSMTNCRFQNTSENEKGDTHSEAESYADSQDIFYSPLGKELIPTKPPEIYIEKYLEAKDNYQKDSTSLDNIIWLGRRTAYLGKYRQAIDLYSKGIVLFPEEPRLYRHRGHRYISIREFDKAIVDLEKASRLIVGQDNQIEEDGLPNAQNIPVSSLHGNIWYHLGLAYYLKQDFEKAFEAYLNGRKSGENDDNIVSTTHWLYMIQMRMGNAKKAQDMLDPIHQNMNIIENKSYYDLCRFYKGMIPVDSLLGESGTPSGDAVMYGLANWYLYNNDLEKAKPGLDEILAGPAWSSFGYIAAEQDYLKYFK